MAKEKQVKVFNTDKRIRLGIWGLGRGMSFFSTCKLLNIDVVAGCDYNEHMRVNFLNCNPGAYVTADADEFLKQDFDAVLLATFCPSHADDAIKCLQAGKHVLSEVTSFFTMAEGVRLVEAVEKRGLVYQLAENYPFSAANMWLANRWKEGLFGDLMYAEYEYVHECRSLCYTYIDGKPVMPGHNVHNWRSWFNFHYYNTHSLGPVMVITGTRPVMVETFPSKPHIAGYLPIGKNAAEGGGSMTPSLIQMDNGAVVRNLMGAGSSDSHHQRLWGTLGASEIGHDGLKLRLGASGGSPMLNVNPIWEGLGELAAKTGHGGGDFWTLYYFAREILTGEKGPFDIYGGCDVTIPGIQALRSSLEGGKPMEVPDFRKKADRDRYRNDDWMQDRYDTKRGVFGGIVPKPEEKAANFATTIKDLISCSTIYRAYVDWKKVRAAMSREAELQPIAKRLLDNYDKLVATYKDARAIINAYPKSDGANVLAQMLEVGEEKKALEPSFLKALKADFTALKRKFGDFADAGMKFEKLSASALQPLVKIQDAEYPGKAVKMLNNIAIAAQGYINIQAAHKAGKNGIVYIKGYIKIKKAGKGILGFSADGPVKVFLNKKEVGCEPKAINPILPIKYNANVTWKAGLNEVVFALNINGGGAWGVAASIVKG